MDEKQLEQYNPENRSTPIDRDITQEELDFIKYYKKMGDGKNAIIAAFPHKHYTESTCKRLAGKLIKKFALKEKGDKLIEINTARPLDRSDELVAKLKREYNDGNIDVNKMFAEMTYLAYHYNDAKIRLDALKTLHSWYDKVKMEIRANKLEGVDIVTLMADALSTLPGDKYLDVLQKCRSKRQILIKKRSKKFDPEKILIEEREKMRKGDWHNVENG